MWDNGMEDLNMGMDLGFHLMEIKPILANGKKVKLLDMDNIVLKINLYIKDFSSILLKMDMVFSIF